QLPEVYILVNYWIGLSDTHKDGTFHWVDDLEKVTFTNWGDQTPRVQTDEDCVTITPYNWEQKACDSKFHFLCEKFADCNNTKYGTVCPVNCSSTNCAGPSKRCSIRTGVCLDGCDVGYEGPTCADECSSGSYGQNCTESCSKHCAGENHTCHHITGACHQGCAPGFRDELCIDKCENGTYGRNCRRTCSPNCEGGNSTCHHVSGSCDLGCTPGFRGDICRDRELMMLWF
ncbi:multiple epidermal growth factor-like domains 10, partial [Elysia marginata]